MFDMKSNSNKPRGAVRRQDEVSHRPVIKLRYLIYMMLFGSLVAAAWHLRMDMQQQAMVFEDVNIDHEYVNLSPADVDVVVKANLVGDYFTLDLESMRDALLQLPWVQEVSVRRHWPTGLDISIEEKTAIAHWGEHQVLSDRGVVFQPVQPLTDLSLPVLQGPEGLHAQVWQFYVDVSTRLADFDEAIASLEFDSRRSWQVNLSRGLHIELGRNHIDNRLKRLYQVFDMSDAIEIGKIEQIDMRYPNGFAARYAATSPDTEKNKPVSNYNMDGFTDTRVSEV